MQYRAKIISMGLQWLLGLGLTLITLGTALSAPDWPPFPAERQWVGVIFGLSLVLVMLEATLWQKLAAFVHVPAKWLRVGSPLVLFIVLLSVLPGGLSGQNWVVAAFIVHLLGLGTLVIILKNRNSVSLGNLAVTLFTLGLMLVIVELAAPAATEFIAEAQHQQAVDAALENSRSPIAPEDMQGEESKPIGLSPQWELTVPGGGPAWGEKTGWGTRTDAEMHYWMDGAYDVTVTYNSLGFRGPAIPYEKPDDVYRILIVGDSFIEAREVAYEDTLYAQLGDLLAQSTTPDGKRIDVFGVGAVGWGTAQAYLYYHHEGALFNPDLVIHAFYINDVTDNHPSQFYPDRNIDFLISDDENKVELLSDSVAGNRETKPGGARWLEAWPGFLQDTNTAKLLWRILAPPRESVTLAGNLGQWHPQNFIFARLPEIEGYAEAWRRTERSYQIWAEEAAANDTRLMVLAIDYPEERVTELQATFISGDEQTWVWDADLPYTTLAEILTPLAVPLILTRERYADYAKTRGKRPFDALFFVEDGHWNPEGHRLTAEILAETLTAQGIVENGG